MDVERNGYIFDGWYQDANFQTPANKNEAGDYIYQNSKTYYAKWVYNITLMPTAARAPWKLRRSPKAIRPRN